ncbi:restriction endonuclease subunit S, partial [Methanoculleus sp. MH98A]|uniref:restriction endonuclease subunit S n=1 Tax=Methanoculleus sp. MH98A TaxID=1495314 RepID=UPI0012DF40C2
MSDSCHPDDWPIATLGEKCRIEIGGTPARKDARFWADDDDGYPWVAISDLGSKWIFQTTEKITKSGIKNSNVKLVPKGTVLMSFKLTLGRVGIASIDLYTNEAIAAFYPNSPDIVSAWLYYSLPGIAQGGCAEQAIKGQTLNKAKLQKLLLRLPPAEEQRRIAAVLSTIDEAIEKTEALIDKLRQVKAGLMQDLLTKGIDEEGRVRSEETHAFKDSEIGRVPVEWEISSIGQVATFVGSGITPSGGSRVYKANGIPFLRSQNIHVGGLRLDNVACIDEKIHNSMQRTKLQPYDVLLNITGASIGRCTFVPQDFGEGNVNQHVCI